MRLIQVGLVLAVIGAPTLVAQSVALPGSIVGEWGLAANRYRSGVLDSGAALFIHPSGEGAWLGAPPPIGARMKAQFDSTSRTLTLRILGDHDELIEEARLTYDSGDHKLRGKIDDVAYEFSRRGASIPPYIIKQVCEDAPPSPLCKAP